MLFSLTLNLLLLFMAQFPNSQPLDPVSLCSESPVTANRSGVIVYDPTSPPPENCELTLEGFQRGLHISLVGLDSDYRAHCNRGETNIRVNDGYKHCTPGDAVIKAINIVTISADERLKLEVLTPGTRRAQIHYYRSKSVMYG